MEENKISVIVPVYKVEEYLPRCLDSIINQTYKNLEIILIDDGSPDNSGKICDEYAKKNKKIKVIHKENGGASSARNAGLDIMSGDYVTFVDSDDYIRENMIERMLLLSKINNADVVQISFERDEEKFKNQFEFDDYCRVVVGDENIKNFALDRFHRPDACGKLYRSEILRELRFDEAITYAEDLELGLRAYKAIEKSVVSNEKLYFYRPNDNSATASSLSKGRVYEPKLLLNAALNEKECDELYECIMFRYARCSFAVLNRVVSENRADLYDDLHDNILKYKNDIMKNQYLGLKYKIGIRLLGRCKNFKQYSKCIKFMSKCRM